MVCLARLLSRIVLNGYRQFHIISHFFAKKMCFFQSKHLEDYWTDKKVFGRFWKSSAFPRAIFFCFQFWSLEIEKRAPWSSCLFGSCRSYLHVVWSFTMDSMWFGTINASLLNLLDRKAMRLLLVPRINGLIVQTRNLPVFPMSGIASTPLTIMYVTGAVTLRKEPLHN